MSCFWSGFFVRQQDALKTSLLLQRQHSWDAQESELKKTRRSEKLGTFVFVGRVPGRGVL